MVASYSNVFQQSNLFLMIKGFQPVNFRSTFWSAKIKPYKLGQNIISCSKNSSICFYLCKDSRDKIHTARQKVKVQDLHDSFLRNIVSSTFDAWEAGRDLKSQWVDKVTERKGVSTLRTTLDDSH